MFADETVAMLSQRISSLGRRDWFLPSVDLYMEDHPERRADVVIGGRGSKLPG